IPGSVHRLVNEQMDRDAAIEWLASFDFQDPAQSLHNLELLRDAPAFSHSPARMKNLLSNVLTLLLESSGGLVRPDAVLNRFETIVRGVGAREAFYRSLLENPKSIYRLSRVLALSEHLSDILLESPEAIEFQAIPKECRKGARIALIPATADRSISTFFWNRLKPSSF